MLPFFKKKPTNYFSEPEKQLIVNAIKQAETNTSGEIRVFIENKCSYVDAIDRAKELFEKLKMFETEQRNGVLLYVALKDRQLAIFGDKGIYEKTGVEFWNNEVNELITVEELCEILMVGKNTAYKLLSTGELKAFRINRVWKIPRQAVTDYILSKANYPVT